MKLETTDDQGLPRPVVRDSRETIAGLARGLAVIRAFSAGGPFCTLTEIANIAELSPAAARRCLHTLEDLGYVGRKGRQFFLRARVLDLSTGYLDSINGDTLAREHLQDITIATGQSASLAVLDGGDIIYLARIGPRRIVRVEASVGMRYPAYATSLGRVLLAGLPDEELDAYLGSTKFENFTARTTVDPERLRERIRAARSDGYALVEDELAIGVLSLAVPIHDRSGMVIAAINCSAQTGELTRSDLKKHLPLMLATARQISHSISRFPALLSLASR
ncbi:MAG: IclR family transcriptional regulator C-terminal domain-containing protein [Pseudomonadota bacterium]